MAKPDPSMASKSYVLRQLRQDMKNEDEMDHFGELEELYIKC